MGLELAEELREVSVSAVGVASGNAGMALLFHYAAMVDAERRQWWEEAAAVRLEASLDGLETVAVGPSLCDGFAGVAWVVECLRDTYFAEDPNEEVDRALVTLVRESPQLLPFELLYGLGGLGIYGLERARSAVAGAMLIELIVAELVRRARWEDDAVTWLLEPQGLLTAEPQTINFGVAHGVGGLLAFLGGATKSSAEARRLLHAAVRGLQREVAAFTGASMVPTSRPLGGAAVDARVAWCYGDAGVAAALLAAERADQEADWQELTLAVAQRATERPARECGVVDATICHGSAGLALLFCRLAQSSTDAALLERARYWVADTLARRREGHGVSGYVPWSPDGAVAASAGLLTGTAGVAMALLAATSEVEPFWDRWLGVSCSAAAAEAHDLPAGRFG